MFHRISRKWTIENPDPPYRSLGLKIKVVPDIQKIDDRISGSPVKVLGLKVKVAPDIQ